MNEKHKAARIALGGYFADRRKQMGHTMQELANHLGISSETVKGVESGRFAYDIDLLFKFCEALEMKPFFALLEELGKGSATIPSGEKFLLCPDDKNKQLYILHRQSPACLILVVQTVPVTFKIVDLYDDINEDDLATHPFLEEAKAFWREKEGNNESSN